MAPARPHSDSRDARRLAGLRHLGLAALAGGLSLFWLATHDGGAGTLALASLAVAMLGYLAFAVFLGTRADGAPLSRRARWLLLGVAALARASFVAGPPTLSDDLYRYVWDGRVQAAGVNPFVHAPASGALTALRDDAIWPRVNHPEVRTIYPPLAQLVFLAARGPLDSPTGFKALFALLDLATCVLLWRVFARRGRERLTLLYAFHPLVLVELSHSGHMDALLLFFLVLAFERADAGRARWAAAALGAAIATKLFALILLPFFARRARSAWLIAPALVAALYLPYAGAGSALFSGLSTYAGAWRFNESAFALLEGGARAALTAPSYDLGPLGRPRGRDHHAEWVLRESGVDPADTSGVAALLTRATQEGDRALRDTLHQRLESGSTRVMADALSHGLAQAATLLLLGVCVLFLWRRGTEVEPAALWTFAGLLGLSAAVQPWYATWLVPCALLVLARERASAATAAAAWGALVFSATVVVAYVVFVRGPGEPWQVPAAWRAMEYGVPLGVAAWVARSRRGAAHAAP